MLIKQVPTWHIRESLATPEQAFLDRASVTGGRGIGGRVAFIVPRRIGGR